MLCAAKVSGIESARKKLIPITRDSRVPMKEVHQMFAGKLSAKQVLESVIPKTDERKPFEKLTLTERSNRYYALLYIGLFQEMNGDMTSSLKSMKRAAKVNPLPSNEVMGAVADIHMKLRGQKK